MSELAKEQRDLKIDSLSKTFYSKTGPIQALKNITLDIPSGKIVCVVGASGCGKSTLLRIIAGLETDYEGSISLGGRSIAGPGVDRGVVFQEHRLLPWLTVEQNVMFGLERLRVKERKLRAEKQLELVGLSSFARAYPNQLSGGMAQRVAIARALVNQPEILLLDEPFGALDALTKIQMQQEFLHIWELERTTMIMVTHDIDEAVYLGDQVVIMSNRPGAIKSILPVSIERPRDRSDMGFVEIRRCILNEFFTEAKKPFVYVI
jgi:sulfonate transport system ATP-binding protein